MAVFFQLRDQRSWTAAVSQRSARTTAKKTPSGRGAGSRSDEGSGGAPLPSWTLMFYSQTIRISRGSSDQEISHGDDLRCGGGGLTSVLPMAPCMQRNFILGRCALLSYGDRLLAAGRQEVRSKTDKDDNVVDGARRGRGEACQEESGEAGKGCQHSQSGRQRGG
nr:hypothetical protein CFP56_32179 [Quercus suber]